MATINKSCSVFNAFNFRRDVHDSIGHVTALSIGEDATLAADFTLKEPVEEGDVQVVGAISSFNWDGGYAQPLTFTMQVSVDNKNTLATLVHTTMKSLKVTINFNIYEYDRDGNVFYKSVHSNEAELAAVMQVHGTERVFYLDDHPGHEVEQPLNYGLTLGVVPEEQQQEIHIAVSQSMKFVKPWGVTRG